MYITCATASANSDLSASLLCLAASPQYRLRKRISADAASRSTSAVGCGYMGGGGVGMLHCERGHTRVGPSRYFLALP